MRPSPGSSIELASNLPSHHLILLGDARSMDDTDDSSVQLIVTSPPYWQLKDYSSEDQIGFNDTYERYINNLNLVWHESFRVLEPGCRLCVNIGDQFARAAHYGRYKVIPIRTEIIRFCETIGFDYMGAIIWQKTTTMNTSGGGSVMGSYPYPRNGIIKIDYEFILIFKKRGTPSPPSKEAKRASKLCKEDWNEYFKGHWTFPGERQQGHLARFPVELPRRLIAMFSFVEDSVLDPFLGSGTTSLAALNLGRNSTGYEINSDYIVTAWNRLARSGAPGRDEEAGKQELLDLTVENELSTARVEFREAAASSTSPEERLSNLPYRFSPGRDLERKVNPKTMSYGSVISGRFRSDQQSLQSLKVASIKDIDEIVLSDGRTVSLIGVCPLAHRRAEAVQFLKEKTGGRRVYVQTENENDTVGGKVLPVYLFLKNRTNLNAHLIKNGLAAAERDGEYRFKNRFIKYEADRTSLS